jgi:F0F1-type ATP synthase assembly protein I
MPFNRPIPQKKPQPESTGLIGAWVQAEKMMQIVLLLPSAAFVGWLIGYGLDHWLHQTWIAMAGVVLGIISGLVGAVRMAMFYAGDSKMGGNNGNGTASGGSDSES